MKALEDNDKYTYNDDDDNIADNNDMKIDNIEQQTANEGIHIEALSYQNNQINMLCCGSTCYFRMFKYAHENACPCNEDMCIICAVEHDNSHCLECAHEST